MARFYQLFPPEQMLVLISEETWATGYNYSAVDEFLGLKESIQSAVLDHRENPNVWANHRVYKKSMDNKERELLNKFFKEPNKKLCSLLLKHGYTCPEWAPDPYVDEREKGR